MQNVQHPSHAPGRTQALAYRVTSSRISRSVLVGVAITLLLTCVEIALLWILYPFHPPAKNVWTRLGDALAFPHHFPLLWFIPLGELVIIATITFMLVRPLAIRAYLRASQQTQEMYRTRHTSLQSLADVYETPVTYYQHTPDLLHASQGKKLSLGELPQQVADQSFILLGTAGSGKTLALYHSYYLASQSRWEITRGQQKICLYIPLKNYNIFLKKQQLDTSASNSQEQGALSDENIPQGTFRDFLLTCNLPGLQHLRPYLKKLLAQGRLLILCDGLDEVAPSYRLPIGRELAELVLTTQNRFVITCRKVDYQEQQELRGLVSEGHIEHAVLEPLPMETVRQWIERYIHDQGNQWQHTAGQLMQLLTHSRLRYLCTNPLLLFTFLETIDKAGVERGKTLDTRGRLFREYVNRTIKRTQAQPTWKQQAQVPSEKEVKFLLSRIACAAHYSHDPDAIQLPMLAGHTSHTSHTGHTGQIDQLEKEASFTLTAEALLTWFDTQPIQGVFSTEQPEIELDAELLARVLHFSHDTGLIDIDPADKNSHNGFVLSFRHKLLADYFVANYLLTTANAVDTTQAALTPLAKDMLHDPAYWSVPFALWAGLLDNPAQLAEQFISLGKNHTDYVLPTTALSLIGLGVAWTPPTATQRENSMPVAQPPLATTLVNIVHNNAACEKLAATFTTCAEEGAFELYHALFPLIMVEGLDEFFLRLEPNLVLTRLFTYLQETADLPAFENAVKRLCRVLWQFGVEVVPFASTVSQPTSKRSLRLRSAAINILGGTQSKEAVEPLMERLEDSEKFIVERAGKALQRLGPELSLERLLAELENKASSAITRQVHATILVILARFLGEQDSHNGKTPLTPVYSQRILDALILMLSANYHWESDIQKQAQAILVRLAAGHIQLPTTGGAPTNAPITQPLSRKTQEKTITLLIHYLASGDEMLADNVVRTLQEIGNVATPYLLEQLHSQPSETVRMRIVEVLQHVQDNRALPDILRLVADSSPLVQKQVTTALQRYGNDSISGLIALILTDPDEQVAERAVHILSDMGEKAVIPTIQALTRLVPGRTRLLVLVLDTIHDPRAIPALITLLPATQSDPLLTISVIRTLSHFATKQVVSPMLTMLTSSQVQVSEEAIEALSSLGLLALDELAAALDTAEETPTTTRTRRAILGIVPFPGEQLLLLLPEVSNAQAEHIMTVFRMQGADAAHILVQNLFHKHERTRYYVRQTLSEMPGPTAVPPLVEMLNHSEWRALLTDFLLIFPDAAIPTLVNLLGDPERNKAAVAILPLFGPEILPALISGLDDPRNAVQEHARSIIVALVFQNPEALTDVVQLFALSLPLRAHEALLEVLTNELVEVSIPTLLEGLEDAHLVEDVSEALVRLSRKLEWQQTVLSGLLEALSMPERRRGAETALIKIGASAVRPVGELITDPDLAIARAAQHILSEIGVPALAFIWTAHGDTSNRVRREAAMNIFRNMPTEVIKDALVDLLGNDRPEDMAMAQALLLERIHDEASLPPANREMIPALLEYVQIHDRERSSLRILALLLLLGGEQVISHLVQVLYEQPEHHEQLAYAFLFLGDEARGALLEMLNDPQAPTRLRAEAISMLGLLGSSNELHEYARSLSTYGLSVNRSGLLKPDQLAIALRAVGSLLASGDWDIPTLQNLRRITPESSPQSELYNVLLGWRYQPDINRLQSELQSEREARKTEIMNLTARIVHDQAHIRELTEELEQVRHEHGERGDELFQVTQEREDFRTTLEHTAQERDTLRQSLMQSRQEREIFLANLEQLRQEKQALQEEIAHLEAYNTTLLQQLRIQRGTTQ